MQTIQRLVGSTIVHAEPTLKGVVLQCDGGGGETLYVGFPGDGVRSLTRREYEAWRAEQMPLETPDPKEEGAAALPPFDLDAERERLKHLARTGTFQTAGEWWLAGEVLSDDEWEEIRNPPWYRRVANTLTQWFRGPSSEDGNGEDDPPRYICPTPEERERMERTRRHLENQCRLERGLTLDEIWNAETVRPQSPQLPLESTQTAHEISSPSSKNAVRRRQTPRRASPY